MLLWPSSDGFNLYDGYLWSVDCLCSVDVVYGDWEVSNFIFSTASFIVCVDGHPTSC